MSEWAGYHRWPGLETGSYENGRANQRTPQGGRIDFLGQALRGGVAKSLLPIPKRRRDGPPLPMTSPQTRSQVCSTITRMSFLGLQIEKHLQITCHAFEGSPEIGVEFDFQVPPNL